MIKTINSPQAPAAVGPYSHAVATSSANIVFLSGQIPLNPETNQVEATGAREQTQVVLKNLALVLKTSGSSIEQVVKTTVYLKNMGDYAEFNQEYEKFFGSHKPARACVEVARLPRDVLVEIDAIAVI